MGQGVGLSNRLPGDFAGVEATTLSESQIPFHLHTNTGILITGYTGGSQPFGNLQPSLAVSFGIATAGAAPSPDTASDPTWLGQVRMFAAPMLPAGYAAPSGQVLSISENPALFAVIGNQYGGNAATTFALPDLRGRAVNHVGAAVNGTFHSLGSSAGSENVLLTDGQLPAHTHTLPAPPLNTTGSYGADAPFNNMQPSLTLNYIINTVAHFPVVIPEPPNRSSEKLRIIADDQAPLGWSFCDGQVLSIAESPTLFAVLGSAYGGDGLSTFALPDLRGRVLVGAGDGPGLTPRAPGQAIGQESSYVTIAELPPHSHSFVPFNADFDSNNIVDGRDFLIWQRGYGTLEGTRDQGNSNANPRIDGFDLAVWQAQYGSSPPAPILAVPEPSAVLLTLWGLASFTVSVRCPFSKRR